MVSIHHRQASSRLYNDDLAPARERHWGAFSLFNVWTSDVHSLFGYYLAASLFLLCGGFVNFIITIGISSLVIFVIMTLVGYAGMKTGVPYPVLARASFGIWGANLAALIRALVACFWYGAQTSLAASAIVAMLTRSDVILHFQQNTEIFGQPAVNVICYVVVWALQLLIIQKGMDTVRRFQNWAGPAVWIAMLVLAVGLWDMAGGFSLTTTRIPHDLLLKATHAAGVRGEPGSLTALMAVGATWITYFAALYLNFCDFARYTPTRAKLLKGNMWGLPINLLLFSLVSGITTILAYQVYGEVLVHPEDISAKFGSLFLAALAALVFVVATLGINVVANFVSPAFDISNTFPRKISFKGGGYITAVIALVLYPFAPWNGNAAVFVNAIGAIMGPLLGVILVDFYLIAKGRVNVAQLYQENGAYRFHGGWNIAALIATGIGAIVCSVLPYTTDLMPSWWSTYGWFIGVAIGSLVYYPLAKLPLARHPASRVATPAEGVMHEPTR